MSRRTCTPHILLLVLVMTALPVLACSFSSELASSTPTPTALAAPQRATAPLPSGVIKSLTMALGTKGDDKIPVNPTIVFAPDSTFHAIVAIENAPANSRFRAVWYATDIGAASTPNTLIDSFDLTSEGTRNLDFTLSPKSTWPPGTYRVEVSVNGNLERVVDFSVSDSSAGNTTVKQPTAIAPKASGYISSVTMAQNTKGDDRDPVNPTTVFQPESVFHAVVAIKNAPKNTKFTAVWYVVDVGKGTAPNTKIDATDLTTDGTRNLDFSLNPDTTWPAGAYRVDILVNGVLDQTATFSVK